MISAQAGKRDELVEFLQWDADVAASDEPGTLRFDVYDVPDRPDAVYLYEAYANEESFAVHREAPPFKRFVDHIIPNVIASMDVLLRSAPSIAANVA